MTPLLLLDVDGNRWHITWSPTVLRQHPGRTVIWVDDELHTDSSFRRWGQTQEHVTCLGPDPASGLTAQDLQVVAGLVAGR